MSWNTCLSFSYFKVLFWLSGQDRAGRDGGGTVHEGFLWGGGGGVDTDCVPSAVRMPAVQVGVVGLMSLDSEMDVRI